VRQERRQQRLGVVDQLQRHVQDGVAPRRIVLELPRRLVGQVLVGLAHHAHRLGDGRLLLRAVEQRTHGVEGRSARRQHVEVDLLLLAGLRDAADVLRHQRQRAVDQVAPAGHELGVVARDELLPGEVGVAALRPGDGQVVAQRVGP
jgi:hypothetical protein